MSNDYILMSSLISMVFRSVIRCMELCMLYVYGRCRFLHNVFVKCVANFYVGAFFQVFFTNYTTVHNATYLFSPSPFHSHM
jgi:hypothetical protein